MSTSKQSASSLENHEKNLARAKQEAEQRAGAKLNNDHPELQGRLNQWVLEYTARITHFIPSTGERIDYPRFGMLAELMSKTPARVYDLPELKMHVDTAFVDTTSRMYISDTFFVSLEKEQLEGKNSLFFLFSHEMEHLRRMHLQRMLDFPPRLANIAQDIRINCDIIRVTVGDTFHTQHMRGPSDAELKAAVVDFYDNVGETLKMGCAMSDPSEFLRWDGMSEEEIATELLKNWKDDAPNQNQDQEVSFPRLCEGVAQDLDAMSLLAGTLKKAAEANGFTKTAVDARFAAKARGKITPQKLVDLYAGVEEALLTEEMMRRNLQHTATQQSARSHQGTLVGSVHTGDPFIDGLTPIERLSALLQILKMVLNPSSSQSADGEGMKIKDLHLPRSNPSGPTTGKPGEPGQFSDEVPSGTPSGNIYAGDEHVMDAQKLAEILKSAGVHDALKALGYDDLEKISAEEVAAKANVTGAVNQASEDMMRLGGVYRGGHMVDYAVAQLNDFYKPRVSWKLANKKIIEGLGNKSRYDQDEPFMQYYSPYEDQGLSSEDDVGYQGSYQLGEKKRPLVFYIIDTSGSVTDAMLKRFISESVQAARESGNHENAPQVVIVFADTIARGKPVYITTENYAEFMKNGLNYGGRGGTNFTASVQNAFLMVSNDSLHQESLDGCEESNSLRGRRIDAMVYFTDTFDAPPDQATIEQTAFECGMSRLPTMLFMAPKSCYSEGFKNGVAAYAETIFFDTDELDVDFEEMDANIEARGLRASAP